MAQHSLLLAIEYNLDDVPAGGSAVLGSLAAPVKHKNKDAAGHIFHDYALRQSGFYASKEEEAAVDVQQDSTVKASPSQGSFANDDQPPPGVSWKGKKKKKKKSEKEDLYALLGLQNERWTATDAQIKLAYRKAALEHHPDKAGAATADETTKLAIEEKFKAIQEAYETLSDPAKRREFDSTDDFDDTLPADCAPEDFIKVFGPAFRRNTRWSVATPVPEVGEDETPWEEVDKFYDFWFSFKSWREFPHPDEEDVEQAECREEKRWLERMNAKLREAGKKEEKRRLKEFVENAYRCDPRVIAHKEAQRAERDRKKREKEAERQRKAEAEKRARAEEAAKKAAEEAAAAEAAAEARKARQIEKKATQKERSRLRGLCASMGTIVDDMVELLCANLQKDDLAAINASLSADDTTDSAKEALLKERVGEVERALYGEQRAKEEAAKRAAAEERAAKRVAERNKVEKAKEWSDEEVRLLEKALDKFPQGTVKRWEQVSAYVRTRAVDEVLDMVKHGLKAGRFAPKQDTFSVAKKRQANTTIASDATQRVEAFTDVDVNLSGKAAAVLGGPAEAASPTANGHAAPQANGSGTPRSASRRAPAPMPAAAKEALTENGGSRPRLRPANGKASPAKPSDKKAGDSGAWSEAQELALVQALKKFGKDDKERWEHVAQEVPGQGKAECMRRFKELRESFRSKKDST
ncbi:g1855 [Coccomyxa elongata]